VGTTTEGSVSLAGRWPAIRAWLGTAARLLLAGTFLWAGIGKIGDPAASVRAVRAYRLLPEWLAKGTGYGLPYLEIALAVLLLIGIATRFAAIVSGVLLAVFLAGIISAAARGLRIECGCFGGGGTLGAAAPTHYTGEILRDIGLLLVAVFLVLWPRTRLAVDDAIRRSVPGAQERVGPRRTKAAQERLAALAAAREARGEQRVLIASALCALLLVGIAGGGIGIQAARVSEVAGPQPQAVSIQDGVTVGKASAKISVDLYEDMQCPICAQFESNAGSTLQRYVDAGTVKVHYYVISFLNGQSTTNYSSRAGNAAYCAADAGVFVPYVTALFRNQPAEGSAGLTDDQLISYAKQAGVTSDTFGQCVKTRKYNDFLNRMTDQSSKDGISGTPTVLVNRTQVPNPNAASLQAAIAAAA
jgi:protein-disulfide isomerase